MKHIVRFRVDFTPSFSVGPGKISLLQAIERVGSLSHAARSLGMSYRRAWLLLDDMNRSFREPVATSTTGSAKGTVSGGGGTKLTPFGSKLVRSYLAAARAIEAAARSKLKFVAPKAPERSDRSRVSLRKALQPSRRRSNSG